MAKIAAGAAATVPAAPCATSASRWPHGGWIEIVHGKDVGGVSSRFLAELAQQPGASIRISGGVTLISSEIWFCCPLWADRKGLQWRLVLPHSASAFPQRLLQTGPSAPVMSFGRRLAYESLRRTNPRAGGGRYGELGFGRCRGGRARRHDHALGPSSDASLRVGIAADGPSSAPIEAMTQAVGSVGRKRYR